MPSSCNFQLLRDVLPLAALNPVSLAIQFDNFRSGIAVFILSIRGISTLSGFLWVILDLKMKRKKTLVRLKLFWICLAYLHSRWDYLPPGQSIQWSITFSYPLLHSQYQRSSLQDGRWNSHGSLFYCSWLDLV